MRPFRALTLLRRSAIHPFRHSAVLPFRRSALSQLNNPPYLTSGISLYHQMPNQNPEQLARDRIDAAQR